MKIDSLMNNCLSCIAAALFWLAIPAVAFSAPSQEFVLKEITVTSILVDNNRIIPAKELEKQIAPYLNKRISYVDLELLRNSLTLWVVQNGYVNSGVVIPDQEIADGVIHLAVVEGKLLSINVEGTRQFSKEYFVDRISRRTEPPFRIGNLQEAFQLLYQDQRISAINAELSGGLAPGEGNLTLKVTEASPWQLTLSATNDNPPSIGSYRGGILAAHRNLTGAGDILEAYFGGSEGGYDYGARYSRPLTPADTMLDVYFRRGDSSVIDRQFRALDVNSDFATYGTRISHPLKRSLQREIRPSLLFEYRESNNFLLGQGFSFSEHENNGESRFSVARAGLEWVERREGAVIVASTLFSGGVSNEHFFTWQGRLLWMQQTGLLGSRLHLRGETQLADTGLPPMEQYALGGLNSVRGYRKNVLIKDNGVTASLEWWFPLVRDSASGTEYLSAGPFFDYGHGWNSGQATGEAARGSDLSSVGVGLRFAWKGLAIDFFYGYALQTDDISTGSDPQDQGIHFVATWNAF